MAIVLVIVASMVLVAMGAMNSLLTSAQVGGEQAGGVESLAWRLPPTGIVEESQSILRAWSHDDMRGIAGDVMREYFFADAAFMVLYTAILWRLWTVARRTLQNFTPSRETWLGSLTMLEGSRRWWLLRLLILFDLTENMARWWMFHHTTPGHDVPALAIWASFTATSLKWSMVVVIAAALLESLRSRALWAGMWATAKRLSEVVWRARLATVAVAIFAGLLAFDPTGQVNDLIRQWYDDFWAGVGVVTATCVLGFTAGRSVYRLQLDTYTDISDPEEREDTLRLALSITCVVLAGLAVGFTLHPLWGVVGVLLLILLAELLWRRATTVDAVTATTDAQNRRLDDAGAPHPSDVAMICYYMVGLTFAPLLALLLGSVKAYTPVLFVVSDSAISGKVAGAVLGIMATGVVLGGLLCFLSTLKPFLPTAGALCLVAVAAVSTFTDRWPIPSLVVLAVFLTLFLSGLTVAQRFSERWPVPKGLLVLGFSRIPVALLLVVILGLCSLIADGSAHDARLTNDNAPTSSGVDLDAAWTAWKQANCVDDGKDGEVPLVLVSSQGGGQRAAYWTASVLTELFGTRLGGACGTNPASAVFALGGASGGSLGDTAWVATLDGAAQSGSNWYSVPFAQSDPLTQPLAWMLSVDLARGYIGYRGPDRAAVLEDGVGRRVTGMHDSFFKDVYGTPGGQRPLLVLTGTQVETGCRIAISPIRLTTAGQACDGVTGHSGAPMTSDVLDHLCAKDSTALGGLRRSTAALLSARFPYVSPSGRLYRCTDDGAIGVVDGGYSDNTGIDAMLELWRQLEQKVAEHNSRSARHVKPYFVMLDNHYLPLATPRADARIQELYIPPATQSRPDALDDIGAEQRAREMFPGDAFLAIRPEISPGLQAPLAWSLSPLSIKDLDDQRHKAMKQPAVVAFAGQLSPPGSPP